ncbi:Calcium/calmodulin-dependent protein kinase kinase cmkC [Penicillium canariense]|uniref:Calcium/calmodulin-dependent protein kinase kinase cmkC n=1 Tax=Penicillium canariense TaxID=189055 RepID=A0A9W9I6X9_9EURO|nr:Calcium/calmodulin-dependent protein kinase kinase cmkC [Penicillium canariense]KAJ5169169.1 Calcium/calmodulin-dependent protein kinase kinase cmkC [Penicillium canariense]
MDDTVETSLSDVSAAPSIDSHEGMSLPRAVRIASSGSYDSLQRHRRRNPRARRPVKETLDARSEYTTSQDDGTAEHRINQYIIKQEIGRGSFGAVHLAADQFGHEYAVKEFSKSRLRKRAQSHLLRRPRGPRRTDTEFNSPLHRHPSQDDSENAKNPLYLIKEEIAIMKKLNHSNLVSLIEVLDDPTEDSLYMVMEMCKKGVVMKVGLEERADPYDDEHCRCWFRDLILGIEYLHAQGIVHRDIKPDNCLVNSDDVLKVVDFGVSEMFEKDSDMFTAKSAGSPAFLPPELCVAKHGDVSGTAADIWSMGVTLYCLRYGKLPFEQQSIFELYESIRNDTVDFEDEQDEIFMDMMSRILEKDPAKRINMRELREHPWVTASGAEPLLPYKENTAQIIEPPH